MRIESFTGSFAERCSTLLAFGFAFATTFCTAVSADDTEVFFGQNTSQPNVLFVVDVSGSMGWYDCENVQSVADQHPAGGIYVNSKRPCPGESSLSATTTRLQRVQVALNELLTITNDINVGLLSFTHLGNTLHQEVRPVTENRDDMISSVASLVANGGTPTVGALLDSANYFRGETVPHMGTSYPSPIQSACQSNHVVLLTDGTPYDKTVERAEAVISGTCEAVDPEAGTCGAEVAEWMRTSDHSSTVSDVNGITTHTIGFNFSSEWLPSLSTAGQGQHFMTGSSEGLLAAFDSILEVSNENSSSFAAPAITLDQVTRLSHRDDIYLALFEPNNTQRWSGNLKRYRFDGSIKDQNDNEAIDMSTGTIKESAQSYWSDSVDGAAVKEGGAASMLDVDSRNVYTFTGTATKELYFPANQFHEDNDILTAAMLSVPADERNKLIQWGRGKDVDDKYPGSTRIHMGDPLHSRPTIMTYATPVDDTSGEPNSLVFVGTNDGFLHAINSSDGIEEYAFIPPELLPGLEANYDNQRTINRVYGLDGDLTLWVNDENKDGSLTGSDHAYLYMGMRRGGRNYTALDVTSKTQPKFLWSINGGDVGFEKLGQSWSKPTLAKISVNGVITDVLIFAGGYDAMQDNSNFRSADTVGNDMFIVNARTGALLWNTSDNASAFTAMEYSIPSDPRVIDMDGDGLVDQIYVGDMGGQVWRLDINNKSPAVKPVVTGGVIAQLSGNSPAKNRRFFYPPDVALVYDGKQQFLSVSIGSGNRAHPKDTVVDNRFYMVRQHSLFKAPDGYGIVDKAKSNDTTTVYRPIKENDLYNATSNRIDSDNVEIADNATVALNEKQGWRISLKADGEKVLAPSVTLNGTVVFSTYLPEFNTTDSCLPAMGRGRLYTVNVLDATPIDGDTSEDRFDELVSGGIPPEPVPHIDADGNLRIVVGYEDIEMPAPPLVTRVYWTEKPDY